MDQHRRLRVSETVREELSELIGFEMQDPRLASVDVTDVQVGPDLKHAHVRVGIWGDEREKQAAIAALDHARHYLRHELARRLNLRKMPELHFEADPARRRRRARGNTPEAGQKKAWPGGKSALN